MGNFLAVLLLASAFILGNIVTFTLMMWVFTRKKFVKKYCRWAVSMTEEITSELEESQSFDTTPLSERLIDQGYNL